MFGFTTAHFSASNQGAVLDGAMSAAALLAAMAAMFLGAVLVWANIGYLRPLCWYIACGQFHELVLTGCSEQALLLLVRRYCFYNVICLAGNRSGRRRQWLQLCHCCVRVISWQASTASALHCAACSAATVYECCYVCRCFCLALPSHCFLLRVPESLS